MTSLTDFLENPNTIIHTATADLTTAKRKELADKDEAMPDGSFPIADADDLKKAISTYGLGKNKVADKAWIIKRAKALNLVSQLPAGWVRISHADGEEAFLAFQDVELTLSDPTKSFLKHHGILGMHWGYRKPTAETPGKAKERRKAAVRNVSAGVAAGSVAGAGLITPIVASRIKNSSDKRKFKKLAPVLRKKVAKVSVVDINPTSVKVGKSILESLGKAALDDA